MTYNELKQRYVSEGLNEFAPVRFDSPGSYYNHVCIFRKDGAFNVWFCDERGKPLSEHNGLSETDACEMVYSHAVGQKQEELYWREKQSKEVPESTEPSFTGDVNPYRPPLHAQRKNQDTEANFFSRAIARILNAASLETLMIILFVVAVVILIILYRLICSLSVPPVVTSLILLGIVLAVFIGFRSYLKKNKVNKQKHKV